ncbi:LLM class F420-dependent oxidoreductase [Microbacterium sp. SS28]|uniref:LLM class F420-dependent oxidoreductase n=1 Tax=Microbacterium sp. SS28 TaxID=2919948 RepID=UPI001FAB1DE5|nr:LLM class F420-dependent oxidoreductase [Microbacterium sp. SS28]
MEFGLHIADFTWSSGQRDLGPALARHVRNAEASGIQRITVMDHFWQLPGIGPVEHEMLEAYATLGFIAANTEKALLHTLVTGVIYREPALLAKQVTTLDVLSGGRVGLGIGAAWNEEESKGLGFEFPPLAERFVKLEETIQICLQMWAEEDEPYDGAIYRLERALNSPQSITRPHPYLMIGGGGEKKTLRLVAQYADACNLGVRDEMPTHKLDVLRAHCDDVGRDYDDIEKTAMIGVNPASTSDSIAAVVSSLGELGFAATYVFSVGIDEPARVVELIAGAAEKVG